LDSVAELGKKSLEADRTGGAGRPDPASEPFPALAGRYRAFTALLKANNRALEIMADLQSRMQGEIEIDPLHAQDDVEALIAEVGEIVAALSAMSPAAARGLTEIYEELADQIRGLLYRRRTIPEADLTLPLYRLNADLEEVAGGKAAHLGDMVTRLNLPVPPGFVVTTAAFKRFLGHNGLWESIREIMANSRLDEPGGMLAACLGVERLFLEGDLPPELALAMDKALADLLWDGSARAGLAVRSSAILEDTAVGFAGQYRTVLNVPPARLADEYRRILASQFSPHVVGYRQQFGLRLEEVAMAVAVMLTIPARASGVLYTCNPNAPEQKAVMISAVRGLGASAMSGEAPSSLYLVEKSEAARVLHQEIARQESMTVCLPQGGVGEVPVPPELADEPLLWPAQRRRLVEMGLELEEAFGRPVDMEWAVDYQGEVYLLQARGLRVIAKGIKPAHYERLVAGHTVLARQGQTASPGVAAGPVVKVQSPADLARVSPGSVLVAPSSLPEYAMVLDTVAALVTEVGGPASHLASVARERRVPAIFGVAEAGRLLAEGQEVTVDADRGLVYEGVIQALLTLRKTRLLALADTLAFRRLERALSRIIPLSFTDPRRPEFTPAGCRSLHDVTRYCHEMAMQEMFRYSEACLDQPAGDGGLARGAARRLAADFPLDLYLIDLGGGLREQARGPEVGQEDVLSEPLLSLLRGIHSVEWRGPGAVAAHVLAKSLDERGEEDDSQARALAFRHNYVLVSRQYMNLSTRLGFHYSTLDAYCSSTASDNYIRLTFMRGGADPTRRARRARYIGTILERSGFWVEVKKDNVFARLEKYPARVLESKLEVIGRLIVGTRQMDMLMFNDAVVDWYIEQFMKCETPPARGSDA
jgi:pyruvate,water dikinase